VADDTVNAALTEMAGVAIQPISLEDGISLQVAEVEPPKPIRPLAEDEQLAAVKIGQYLPALDQQVEAKVERFKVADLHQGQFQQELRGVQNLGNEFLARMSAASSELAGCRCARWRRPDSAMARKWPKSCCN